MISRGARLLILLVIRLLVWTSRGLLIRVGGGINISWVLLVVAIMHHGLHWHPIALLGVKGIIWSSLLDGGHLIISNWLVFDRWVRR